MEIIIKDTKKLKEFVPHFIVHYPIFLNQFTESNCMYNNQFYTIIVLIL